MVDEPTYVSNWESATAQGRWRNTRDRTICSVVPIGMIAALQTVLRNALRAPWVSWDKTHNQRPDIDGNWGPITQAALYTYAKQRGISATFQAALLGDARAKRTSAQSLISAIWVTYYAPRAVDLDVGGQRTQRTDPAVLGTLDTDRIQITQNVTLPRFGVRPPLPGELGALAAALPVCRSELDLTGLDDADRAPPINTTTPTSTTTTTTTTTTTEDNTGLFVVAAVGVAAVAYSRRKKRRR